VNGSFLLNIALISRRQCSAGGFLPDGGNDLGFFGFGAGT
jgi:hypothetical protein